MNQIGLNMFKKDKNITDILCDKKFMLKLNEIMNKASEVKTKDVISKITKPLNLRENLNNAYEAYLKAFCKKHDMEVEFEHDEYMVINVADMFVCITDIIYDIDNNLPEDMFVKWYDYSFHHYSLTGDNINLKSYHLGYRP